MITRQSTFFFALCILIVPALGLPLFWKFIAVSFFAIIIMVLSLDLKRIRWPERPASIPRPIIKKIRRKPKVTKPINTISIEPIEDENTNPMP